MFEVIKGNLFNSKCQTLVNTVNCFGVMGAGIALEYRLRYPKMYKEYVQKCKRKEIKTGSLWLFRAGDRNVLNFPTKNHWKYPSKIEFLETGLDCFVKHYKQLQIQSIAFPVLGAGKGSLEEEQSLEIMRRYLEPLDIKVEVYRYCPRSADDLFEKLKKFMGSRELKTLSELTGVQPRRLQTIQSTVQNNSNICQVNQLARLDGIGVGTLEKLFAIEFDSVIAKPEQRGLMPIRK